jgi:hypothetical protein
MNGFSRRFMKSPIVFQTSLMSVLPSNGISIDDIKTKSFTFISLKSKNYLFFLDFYPGFRDS